MATGMMSAPPPAFIEEFVEKVRSGLLRGGQKELDCKYFYDEVGSALFDVISRLHEYGLTRAEERLLRRHSEDIAGRLNLPVIVAELGSGDGRKTRFLLEALSQLQPNTFYCPVEISPTALDRCRRELGQLENVRVVGFPNEYLDGLRMVCSGRDSADRLLVLFFGSTLGNFNREDAVRFLCHVRQLLSVGDALLLGTDLEKPAAQLIAAYDDPLGVTAAFNLNLLARINRELGGDFVVSQFKHEARYNAAERRIEMYLRSLVDQTVRIARGGFEVSFKAGEAIWTENSHKFTTEEVVVMAGQSGYSCEIQYIDQQWPFAQTLLFAV